MNGAKLTLEVMQQHGVEHVFGYPGGAIMPIYDALYQSPIKHYLCRHEQGAAFAAIGYARSQHNKVGVCFATSGPGATNLLTALADAKMDSVPVVAITGQVAQNVMGTDAFQEVDVLGLSIAITKHSMLVTNINELEDTLHKAFDIALSGRPGPVVVDIPKDIQLAECQLKPNLKPVRANEKRRSESLASSIEHARQLIQKSKKPVVYVGGGVGLANAVEELRQFLSVTQLPLVSTLKGLGSAGADYEYDLGMIGMHGRPAANLAVQSCDLLINLGARFDDRVTGQLDSFAPDAKVIHVDIDRAELSKLRYADCPVQGSLTQVLPHLHTHNHCDDWRSYCKELSVNHCWRYDHPGKTIYAPAFLKELSEKAPESTVVCPDVGQHQMWVAQHMKFDCPNNHISSGGFGTMGFGLPAAIGAKIARPDDLVVAVCGDGSFMMNVQELGTVKRFQLPLKIIVIDNQRLGMVRQWQQLFFEHRYSETDLSDNPDFCALAGAFGIAARYINKKNDISEAISQLLEHPGPFLLHVRIDANDNVWPLVPPNSANQNMLMEASPCNTQ